MKTYRTYNKKIFVGTIIISTLALVAWSPPDSGDILMSAGTPAIVIGTNNLVNGASSPGEYSTTEFRGLVAGDSNKCGTGSAAGYSALLGSSNIVNVHSSVVAGNLNTLANFATTFGETVRYAGVFGVSNTIPKNRYSLLVAGGYNSVDAHESLVAGYTNTVNGGVVGGTPATRSAAIGELNNINAAHGYAFGYQNVVSGNRAAAIGSGAKASVDNSTALGKYNAEMVAGDVLVVGNGVDNNNRSTALKVTSDGSVVLGSAASGKVVLAKAQGDISMGDYSN